jgi:superfamily II DNA or RNA helicase
MKMELGLYESLITAQIKGKLNTVNRKRFYIADEKSLDPNEAAFYLSSHLSKAISRAIQLIHTDKNEQRVSKQIEISNKLLHYLSQQIEQYDMEEDLIDAEGRILQGILDHLHTEYQDIRLHLKEITPLSRLTQSELFTGGNTGLSLESELKKEIRSADRVDLFVSFIKWKAIVMLREALTEFTNRGGRLRVITTTYMGATDAKAIEELSKLPHTEIKISYNTSNERLHAKAYLFYRNTGFHTGYIGSSNFSRSALTDGLEWNVKVTTTEIPHIIDKFQKTFESYWNTKEFEKYDNSHYLKLCTALQTNNLGKATNEITQFFDIKPYHYQAEVLERLKVERTLHHSTRNLVVAATGTGKTMIAAFDYKRFLTENPTAKLLFIAHRIEILKQSLHTFRNVLKDQNFGELLGGGYQPTSKRILFATVQSVTNMEFEQFSTKDYYDYLILDEVHHAQADTYQKIIQYFNPKILLGLTATPERMDGKSILRDFNYRIAAEIRLPDALNQKLLCPFQYFGISEEMDYTRIKWTNGKYDTKELSNIYTADDARVRNILINLNKYTRDYEQVTALGFCISIEHAKFMAHKFIQAEIKADYLVSDNADRRVDIIHQFKRKEINYLFVVDIFNEGIDVPEIDTVLFLRPTESLTIFLQQLGRGLRLHEKKDVLTVLDFVGQARAEYDFENKFRALIGKTNTTVLSEIEKDFPHLPLGSSILLEKKAKEHILENIRKSTQINKKSLITRIQNFRNQTDIQLNLHNFLSFYNLKLQDVYKHHTFTGLLAEAFGTTEEITNIKNYQTMLSRKWMATESYSYFKFILDFIENDFDLNHANELHQKELFGLMFYYDFYSGESKHPALAVALKVIGQNKDLVEEMKQFLHVKMNQIYFEEVPLTTSTFSFPLKIHARYTREQILVALRLSTFERKSSNREGVALNKDLHTEVLFINLKKSEEDFSPTTLYDDYAINETLFHWQSQNQTTSSSVKGQSYIHHVKQGKIILLFIRESKQDSYGLTHGYVFIGPAKYVEHTGSKPMSIKWQLKEPIPEYLWTASAKMLIG